MARKGEWNAGASQRLHDAPEKYVPVRSLRDQIVEMIAAASERSSPQRRKLYSLAQADAVEWLGGLAAASIDLLITDPPYESLEKHRATGTTTRLKKSKASSNEWFRIFPNARLASFFQAAFHVMRKNSHLYMFCDPDTLWHAVPAAEAAGFRFWKPIVWDKLTLGMGYHYRRQYEFILFFEKGKRRLQDLGVPDVLRAKRVHGGYPTEKPVEILRTLVRQSSTPQELVCDPFFGSGATGEAAILEGRRFIGSDVNAKALVVARERLRTAAVEALVPARVLAAQQGTRLIRGGSVRQSVN